MLGSLSCSGTVAPSPAPIDGLWTGYLWSESGAVPSFSLQLRQTGSAVQGTYVSKACVPSSQMSGELSARQLTGRLSGVCSVFNGFVSADGRSIDGWYRCSVCGNDSGVWHVSRGAP